MTASELAAEIVNGNFSPTELATISSALTSARELSRDRQTAVMKATLKIGDTVTLTNLRPQSINGLEVTIVDINRKRAVVRMPVTPRAGRFSGSPRVTVPLANVVPVAKAA